MNTRLTPNEVSLLSALKELEPDPKEPCPPRLILVTRMPPGFAGPVNARTALGILGCMVESLRKRRVIGARDWVAIRGRETRKWREWRKANGAPAVAAAAPPPPAAPCGLTSALKAERDALQARHAALVAKAARLGRLEEAWAAA